MGSDIDREPPLAFWTEAVYYLDAAELILEHSNPDLAPSPFYFLSGHAIELALKSFLRARGESAASLRGRKFGHDLEALLTEARRRKLGREVKLSARELAIVSVLNREYSAKRFEYRVVGVASVPPASELLRLVDRLVTSLGRLVTHAA